MKYKLFYDNNRRISFFSADTEEQALSLLQGVESGSAVAIYPSLRAELGVLFRSELWGDFCTSEGLRAVAFYFNRVIGWPIRDLLIELKNKSTVLLPVSFETEEIPIKTKICKQFYEKINVCANSVTHAATLFAPPHPFLLIEGEHIEAVDLLALRGVQAAHAMPICLACPSEDALSLRVMNGIGRECPADDRLCLCALSYFIREGRALHGKEYSAAGGKYRIKKNGEAEAMRPLSLVTD